MNILLCGGEKTEVIAGSIRPRFISGGVEVLAESYIDNIEKLYARGGYFDRALLVEQCWTLNGTSTDEEDIRARIEVFVRFIQARRTGDTSILFITTTELMANIVAQETIEITDFSKVILHLENKYTAAFFIDMAIQNIDEISKNLIYDIDKKTKEDYEAKERDIVYSYSGVDNTASTPGTKVDRLTEIGDDFDTSNEEEELVVEEKAVIEGPEKDLDDELFGSDLFTEDDFLEEDVELGLEDEEQGFEGEELSIEDDAGDGLGLEEEGISLEESDAIIIEPEVDNKEESGSREESSLMGLEVNGREQDISEVGIDGEDNYEEDDCLDYAVDEDDAIIIGDDDEEYEELADEVILEDTTADEISIEINTDYATKETVNETADDTGQKEEIVNWELGDSLLENADAEEIDDGDISISESDLEEAVEDEVDEITMGVTELFGADNSGSMADTEEEDTMTPSIVSQQFGDDIYSKEEDNEVEEPEVEDTCKKQGIGLFGRVGKRQVPIGDVSEAKLLSILNSYKNRGGSLVVTGTHGSGTSTVAYNLANVVCNLGFSVLLVDFDTFGRTQSVIDKRSYQAVHSINTDNASLKEAINSNKSIGTFANIVRPGFHVLTMGLANDVITEEKLAPRSKIPKFAATVRSSYTYIIYDIPFNVAVDYAEDILYGADNILITAEASQYGLVQFMLSMSNIDEEGVQKLMFDSAQVVLTKFKGLNRFFETRIQNTKDIFRRMDREVQTLLGLDPEYYFSTLATCGTIPYTSEYEECWFTEHSYSDKADGKRIYTGLLANVLLKR